MMLSKRDIINDLTKTEELSPCIRRKVGAILINKEGKMEKAYNGNIENPCNVNTCLRNKLGVKASIIHSLCLGIHAEVRLILNCIEKGIDIKNAIVYCTYSPCVDCAIILSAYEIKEFYFLYKYPDDRYIAIFDDADIKHGFIGEEVGVV